MLNAANDRGDRPQLLGLTGLRFFAAFLVVIYHFGVPAGLPFPRRLIGIGNTPVSLFFILSGFVMGYTYDAEADGRYRGARVFWSARFARIYPAYFLSLALLAPEFYSQRVAGASAVQSLSALTDGLAALTLTQGWGHPQTAYVWNFPAWSLSIEAFFYVIYPLLRRWLRPLQRTATLIAMAVVICLANGLTGAYVALDPDRLGFVMTPLNAGITVETTPWLALLTFNPIFRLPQFVLGLLAAKLFLAQRQSRRLGAWLEAAGFASLALVTILSPSLPEAMLIMGIPDPAFLLLICGIACGGGPLSYLLSTRPMVVLGEASYSIYILQLAVARRLGHLVHPVVAIVPIAVAVFYLFERPARRLIMRWLTAASFAPAVAGVVGLPPESPSSPVPDQSGCGSK